MFAWPLWYSEGYERGTRRNYSSAWPLNKIICVNVEHFHKPCLLLFPFPALAFKCIYSTKLKQEPFYLTRIIKPQIQNLWLTRFNAVCTSTSNLGMNLNNCYMYIVKALNRRISFKSYILGTSTLLLRTQVNYISLSKKITACIQYLYLSVCDLYMSCCTKNQLLRNL